MNAIPRIGSPADSSDFHDSRLLRLRYDALANMLFATLLTPSENDEQQLWEVRMQGVLSIHQETLGDGVTGNDGIPPEIYDVYEDAGGDVADRWRKRLKLLGVAEPEVHHIVFASSYMRGWGENEELEGISVVCRSVSIEPGLPESLPTWVSPSRIEGDSLEE